jgi:MFS superfamily sulfate permease-like transporter
VLAFLIVVGTLLPRIPGPLVAVLLAAAASALLALDRVGMQVVGRVPEGLPVPAVPAITLGDLALLLPAALGVAVVAYSDNVLTARAFAAKQRHPLDSDQELLALGVANLATGFLHGFPVSSSASRTTVGHAVGGRSQLTSVVALLAVLVVLTVGGPVLAALPTAALGALVVYAALRLVDVAELHRIGRFRRSELSIALATTTAVLLLGVLYGVLIAAGLSILDLLRRVSRPHDGVLGYVPGLAGMHDIDDYPNAATVPGLVVYRYDAPLCFANAENFRNRALAALDVEPATRWLLLNMEAVIEIDLTAADAVHQLCDELDARGVIPAMARVKQDLLPDLRAGGLADRIGAERIFPTLPTAVAAFRDQQGVELPPSST